MRWVGSYVVGHAMGGVMCSWGITWVGSCVRGSLHGWGHVFVGHPFDNGATHSGKGSICSKLFVRQGFRGWPGWVYASLVFFGVLFTRDLSGTARQADSHESLEFPIRKFLLFSEFRSCSPRNIAKFSLNFWPVRIHEKPSLRYVPSTFSLIQCVRQCFPN